MVWKKSHNNNDSNTHSHTNKNVLDKLSESNSNLMYNGSLLGNGVADIVNVSVYQSDMSATPFNLFSVLDNGLVADGLTDNTQAMQQLVDSVHALGGGIIYAPKGVYNYLSTVYWKSNVSLIGDGVGLTVLKISGKSGLGHSLFEQIDEETRNMSFSNFTINGYEVVMDIYTHRSKAFYFQNVYDSVWRDINLEGTGSTALGIDFLSNVHIDNVTCIDCGRLWGIDANGNEGPGGAGIGIGTGLLPLENLTISNCKTYNCGHFGIFLEHQAIFGLGTEKAKGVTIDNCIVVGGRFHGIGIRGGENVTVSNCQSYENANAGIFLDYSVKKLKLIGNTVSENLKDGIKVSRHLDGRLDNLDITSNSISNNGRFGINLFGNDYGGSHGLITVSNNIIKGNADAPIWITEATMPNIRINDSNVILDNGWNASRLHLRNVGSYMTLPSEVLEEPYNQIDISFNRASSGTLISRKDRNYTTSSTGVGGFSVDFTSGSKLRILGAKISGGTTYIHQFNEDFLTNTRYYLRIKYLSGSLIVEMSTDGTVYTTLTLDTSVSSGTVSDIIAILQSYREEDVQFGREWVGTSGWSKFLSNSSIYEVVITSQTSQAANNVTYQYYFYNKGTSKQVYENTGTGLHGRSGFGSVQRIDQKSSPDFNFKEY